MTFKELHILREHFWSLNKQGLTTLLSMQQKGTAVGLSSKILGGVEEFLNKIKNSTTDEELKADVNRLLGMIATQNANPFSQMELK